MKNHKTLVISAALIASVAILQSCGLNDIDGNYHPVIQNRTVQSFSEVNAEDEFNVQITHDSVYFVEVNAEDNLLPYIETVVIDNELCIRRRTNQQLDNHYPIEITVHTPVLEAVRLSGSGEIRTDTFYTYRMECELSGSGDITLYTQSEYLNAKISGSGSTRISGSTSQADLRVSGSGSIKAISLQTDTCFANISGSGSIYTWVLDFLNVNISGSGNVYYAGQPIIQTSITGSGNVQSY